MSFKATLIKMLFCIFFVTNQCYANSYTTIKLAIFDNPQIDSSDIVASQELQKAYMQGVSTAVYAAKIKGININYKTFFYGSSLLNIIQQVPNVLNWNPNVIVGLHSSNESLMSRTFFTDQQVLSISATDVQLSALPSNFYSLGVPDPYAASAIVQFLGEHYPKHDIFIAVGADSKESIDLENLIYTDFKEQYPQQNVTVGKFLSDETNNIDFHSFLIGYKPGDIIIMLSIAGTYSMQINLMNQISSYLSPNKLVFINDVDNWNGRYIPQNFNKTDNPYTAFRLDTLYINTSNLKYQSFIQNFKNIYHTMPTETISFMTYQAIMSFVTALENYPPPNNLTLNQAILWSYGQARKHNINWFRPMEFVMYKMEPYQEVLFQKFNQKN